MGIFDNSDNHDNRNKPIQLSSASHLPDDVNFPQVISPKPLITPRERDVEKVLFTIRGNGNLGYWSHKTIHYSSYRRNDDGESYGEGFIEASLGEESRGNRSFKTSHCSSRNHGGHESCGHKSQETSHYTSINCVGCGCRSSMTRHYASRNYGGYVDIGGYMSQETIHSSS